MGSRGERTRRDTVNTAGGVRVKTRNIDRLGTGRPEAARGRLQTAVRYSVGMVAFVCYAFYSPIGTKGDRPCQNYIQIKNPYGLYYSAQIIAL